MPLIEDTAEVTAVAAIRLPDERILLATGNRKRSVRVWDFTSATPWGTTMIGHAGEVTALAGVPLPDRRVLLASGSEDCTVRVWDLLTDAARLVEYIRPADTLRSLQLSGARDALTTNYAEEMAHLWDRVFGQPLPDPSFGPHPRVTAAVPVLPGKPAQVAGERTAEFELWDLIRHYPVWWPSTTGLTVRVSVSAKVALLDGRVLAVAADRSGETRLTDIDTRQPYGLRLVGDASPVTAVAVIPMLDGLVLVAVGQANGLVRVWNPVTGRALNSFRDRESRPVAAAVIVIFQDDRVVLAIASDGGTIRLTDPATGATEGMMSAGAPVTSLAVVTFPDGPVLAAGTSGGTIELWDPDTSEAMRVLDVGMPVSALVALPGQRVAIATGEGIIVLQLATGLRS
jgi:WD40 repeat protein